MKTEEILDQLQIEVKKRTKIQPLLDKLGMQKGNYYQKFRKKTMYLDQFVSILDAIKLTPLEFFGGTEIEKKNALIEQQANEIRYLKEINQLLKKE